MTITAKQYAAALLSLTEGKSGKALEKAIKEFLQYLQAHGAMGKVQEILRSIDGAWKKRYGAANILVETAHPLSKKMREEIQALAPGATLTERVSPELIGGARIRIDDRLIDGSVAGSLTRLKQALSD